MLVDGQTVGALKAGETLEVRVAPGQHRIEARIDWCRSRPLDLTLSDGQRVTLEVTNSYGAFLALWAVTFGMRSYLTVKVIG